MPEQRRSEGSSTSEEMEQYNNGTKQRGKVTFYLSEEQIQKLDDLVHEYNRGNKGKRINRNDVVRYLIDQCTIDLLTGPNNIRG
jgi:hypothetical protein